MHRRSRRWLRSGLVLGTAIAGAAYYRYRYRSRSESTDRETDPITERHAAAFLARRRLDPDRIAALRDEVSRRTERDRGWPGGVEHASTASLFLDRSREEPALVWYVEVPRTVVASWDDPGSALADAFPVSHEAIRDVGDGVDRELLVHAVHPSRPRSVVPAEPRPLEGTDEPFEDENGDAGPTVDVELVRMDLESGVPERLADWFAGITRRVIDGELELGRIESWSVEMLEAEAMYTESLFLERRAEGYSLVQYMEAADMQRVYDAYYGTWNPVARLSEIVIGRLLENPADILAFPLGTDSELLAHATNPNRPRRASARDRTRPDRGTT